jgi:hypothetical protein
MRGPGSPVDLAEHDVHGADDRRHVGQGVALDHEVERLEVDVAGRADLAAVGLLVPSLTR